MGGRVLDLGEFVLSSSLSSVVVSLFVFEFLDFISKNYSREEISEVGFIRVE